MGALPGWASCWGLEPHPEGGWFRELWRSGWELPPGSLPDGFEQPRSAATSILFLLLPGEQSAWHRVRGAELWLHQRGGAVALELGGTGPVPEGGADFDAIVDRGGRVVCSDAADSGSAESHTHGLHIVGTDAQRGEQPQVLVPPGCWQRARPAGSEAGLVGCVVVPGFDFRDFTLHEDG